MTMEVTFESINNDWLFILLIMILHSFKSSLISHTLLKMYEILV